MHFEHSRPVGGFQAQSPLLRIWKSIAGHRLLVSITKPSRVFFVSMPRDCIGEDHSGGAEWLWSEASARLAQSYFMSTLAGRETSRLKECECLS